ncbi:MAG: cupin domain-containing protein [Hyphomicrobiaceae bacterium]|nr:cupin domain-containing protein [Hyphomicrobiaceae bacterium]
MEFFDATDFVKLSNPGVVSEQLISPHKSDSERMTITRVSVEPGAIQDRHAHEASEQVWIALSGEGELLLDNETTRTFAAGQVVRFEAGDVHGFRNTANEPFVYLAVTAPPIRFDNAYARNEP